jgi:hypothetical protein
MEKSVINRNLEIAKKYNLTEKAMSIVNLLEIDLWVLPDEKI